MLLNPKPIKTMELTEGMARNILKAYCNRTVGDCCLNCTFAIGWGCRLRGFNDFTADEVFAAVRELAGGEEA